MKPALLKQLIAEEAPELLPYLEQKETKDLLKQLVENKQTAGMDIADIIYIIREAKREVSLTPEFISSVIDQVRPVRGLNYWTEEDRQAIVQEATPVKGEDYYTDAELQEIMDIVRPIKGIDYEDGKPGRTPRAGVDFFTQDERQQMVEEVRQRIQATEKKEEPVDVGKIVAEVVDKRLNEFEKEFAKQFKKGGKYQLDKNDVMGMPLDQRWHGGGLSNITGYIQAGTNITITGIGTASSPYVINSTGGGGTPAGSNKSLQFNNSGVFGGGQTPTGAFQSWNPINTIGSDGTNTIGNPSTGSSAGLLYAPTITQNNNSGDYIVGLVADFMVNGSGIIGGIQGNWMSAIYSGSGSLTDGVYGGQFLGGITSGSTGALVGLVSSTGITGGHADASAAIRAVDVSKTGGTLTDNYGVLIESMAAGVNNWGLYSGDLKASFSDLSDQDYIHTSANVFASLNTPDNFAAMSAVSESSNSSVFGMQSVATGLTGATANVTGHLIFGQFVGSNVLALGQGISTKFQNNSASGGTVTVADGIFIGSASGAITTNNGLRIADQTVGATNYSIYTGLGNIRFGSLAGTGTRLVTASAAGVLSTGTFSGVELAATGSVNGINKTYTMSQQPSYVVADGTWYKATDNNGVTQWSYVGTTLTMVIPPTSAIWGVI